MRSSSAEMPHPQIMDRPFACRWCVPEQPQRALTRCAGRDSWRTHRDEWQHWIDEDWDCQDTRQEVLIEESIVAPTLDIRGCRVLSGMWRERYTGVVFTHPGDLDIDHRVPLSHAHRSGGWSWMRHGNVPMRTISTILSTWWRSVPARIAAKAIAAPMRGGPRLETTVQIRG